MSIRRSPAVLSLLLALATAPCRSPTGFAQELAPPIDNPRIDMAAYLAVAAEAAAHRESRRLTEEEFLALRREPGTVVLDARSRDKYDELHVRGAVNLPFPDIDVARLDRLLPDRGTRILIYCNNNFTGAEGPFPTKRADASLNLSTYVSLYSYGYREVWELGPLLDLGATRIPFEGTALGAGDGSAARPASPPVRPARPR